MLVIGTDDRRLTQCLSLPIFLPDTFKIVFLLLGSEQSSNLANLISARRFDGERCLNFSLVLKVRVHSSFSKKNSKMTSCRRKILTGTEGFLILSYQKIFGPVLKKINEESMYYLIFIFNLSDFSIKCIRTQLMSHIILILILDRFQLPKGHNLD